MAKFGTILRNIDKDMAIENFAIFPTSASVREPLRDNIM